MAVIQIPNLPLAIALNGNEQLEAVQSGVSVRVTTAAIANYTLQLAATSLSLQNPYITKYQFISAISVAYGTKPSDDPNILYQSINADFTDQATVQFYASPFVQVDSPLYNLCATTYSYNATQMSELMLAASLIQKWG